MALQVTIPESHATAYELAVKRNSAGEVFVDLAARFICDRGDFELVNEGGQVLTSVRPLGDEHSFVTNRPEADAAAAS